MTYKNILDDFKNYQDLSWITRAIDFIKAYDPDHPHLSPKQIKEVVSENRQLLDMLTEVCNDEEQKTIKNKIKDILEEIGYEYDLSVIRWLGFFLVKILRKSLSGLFLNEAQLNMITSQMGSSPVIFVPTHRSYADFILMAFVCFKYNIHIPCVAAGMDFLSMRVMNTVLRKSKAFFMRRKFADDIFYRSVFKEYVKTMVAFEESPIEFFIEGTRSRTGKSLSPKFGFLTMVVEAYISGDIPDLTIVPINISYDRVLEETLFAYELLGIPKPKETTKGLFKALKVLDEDYGNVYINFGDPFSVRKFFDDKIDFRYRCPLQEGIKIKQIAYKIVQIQQSLQVYSCFNLLALILNDNIIKTRSYCLPYEDGIKGVQWLTLLFQKYGANLYISGNIEADIKRSICVHKTIVTLSENKIMLKKQNGKNFKNRKEQLEGFSLEDQFIQECVSVIMLQIYVNPSISLFIKSSVIATILYSLSKQVDAINIDILYQHYLYFCGVLKHEFVMNDTSFKDFLDELSKLVDLQIIEVQLETVKLNDCNNVFYFILNLVKPFLVAANGFCKFLLKFQKEIATKSQKSIIIQAQAYNASQISSGDIQDYYSLSLDLLSNLYNSLIDMNVLTRNKQNESVCINEILLNEISYNLGCLINGPLLPESINGEFCMLHLRTKL